MICAEFRIEKTTKKLSNQLGKVMNSVVITLEGVLQKIVSYAPIPSGITLYHGLSSVYNVLLVSDSTDQRQVEHWLALENLNSHGTIIYSDTVLNSKSAEERRLAQVSRLRARGFNIDFVIDPDISVCAALFLSGINILNFGHSSYALPQWRPDYEKSVKPWDEIARQQEELALLKAQDIRLKNEEGKDWL